MMLKTYQKYLISQFYSILLKVSIIFFCLAFILNIFEEINYLKDLNVGFYYPLLLTFLNTPSLLFQIFPFIFLISTQFFFITISDRRELPIYKNFGLNNLRIVSTIVMFAFFLSTLIVIIFYQFSSVSKFFYLDLKNNFSNDNRYLSVVTENGLWIKDEMSGNLNIINAEKISENYLINVSITQFDNNFVLIKNINSDRVDISNFLWKLDKPIITTPDQIVMNLDFLLLETHFDVHKIKSLFSNLTSLTLFQLHALKKDFRDLGYSTTEISLHQHKVFSFPIYLSLMTLFASIIMLNIKHNKPKVFNLITGIMLSVLVYYLNFFSTTLAESEKLPVILSIWLPLIILLLLSTIGLVRINEK